MLAAGVSRLPSDVFAMAEIGRVAHVWYRLVDWRQSRQDSLKLEGSDPYRGYLEQEVNAVVVCAVDGSAVPGWG